MAHIDPCHDVIKGKNKIKKIKKIRKKNLVMTYGMEESGGSFPHFLTNSWMDEDQIEREEK